MGEDEIKAVVVVDRRRARRGEVWAWCDEMLCTPSRATSILPELPKTPTAKILKSELRKAGITPARATAASRAAAGGSAPTPASTAALAAQTAMPST